MVTHPAKKKKEKEMVSVRIKNKKKKGYIEIKGEADTFLFFCNN